MERGKYNLSMTHKTQQDFLREAMESLGYTRELFAERLGCSIRSLHKWLLPATSNDFRSMPEPVWTLIREILAHERLKIKYEKLKQKVKLDT